MLTKEYFKKFEFTKEDKIVFVSHNDLDGAGPIIVADQFFKNYRYHTVGNRAVDSTVKYVLYSDTYKDYDYIFITDCSVSDEVAKIIDKENAESTRKIFLFDHHESACYLNKYSWANVTVKDENGEFICGTKLFFQYIVDVMDLDCSALTDLTQVVETINDWDTWKWFKTNNLEAKALSDLFNKTGIEYFIQKFRNSFEIINDVDRSLLAAFERKYLCLIEPKIMESARIMVLDVGVDFPVIRKVKCVQVTEPISDLAEVLYEDEIDTILFFFQDAVSIRTRDEDVHAGFFARKMAGVNGSGGGHKGAGGFGINKSNYWLLQKYLELRFNE